MQKNKKNSSFTEKIKILRTTYDISMVELANLWGFKYGSTINQFENGLNLPSFETLATISDFFGISLDWLMRRSDVIYTEETVRESEIYCGQAMESISQQFNDYSYLGMWNLFVSQQFPQYVEMESRKEYYSLAVRANISVLMQLVTIPSMYWQFYYAQNGFKKRGVMAKVRETLHIPDTVALKEPPRKEKERSEHLTKLLLLRFRNGDYIPNTMPAYDIEAAYRR